MKQTKQTNTSKTVTRIGKKGKIISFFLCDDNHSKIQPANCFQSTSGTVPLSRTSFMMPLKTIDALQTPKTNKSPQKENPLDDVVTLNGQLDKILAEAQKAQKEKERNKKKKKEEHGKKKTRKNLTKKNTKAKH